MAVRVPSMELNRSPPPLSGCRDTLHRNYREDPRKHKNYNPPLCTKTASLTRRCRRWRAAAAASLEALDRRQSPGEREVAERRSRKTYTVEHRRGQPDAPHLLLQSLDLGAPPPSELTTGKTPTAPPWRCEGVDGDGSKTTLRRAPPPEKRSTARKLRPPCLRLQTICMSSSTFQGKTCLQKPFVVQAKRSAGLEKANTRSRGSQASEKLKKRAPLTRGTVSPALSVPRHITRPPYVGSKKMPEIASEMQMHDKETIVHMRAACELAARVLENAGKLVKPSVTTDEIDKAVHKMIIDAGAYPSPLGYGGFPKSVCTSVNECMCHGIPDSRALEDGDIINIDVTVYLNGFHGDTSKTFLCGEVDEASKLLVKVAEECMLRGIAACKHGVSFKKIGRRISEHAERHGFGVVEQFVGHGVGRAFHSQPIIYHQRNNMPGQMVEGQTFTIEPILTMGKDSIDCDMWDDGWTALTTDGSWATQFEHTILITKTGAEILTKC